VASVKRSNPSRDSRPQSPAEVVIVPDNTLNYQAIVGMDYLERFEIAVRNGIFGQI